MILITTSLLPLSVMGLLVWPRKGMVGSKRPAPHSLPLLRGHEGGKGQIFPHFSMQETTVEILAYGLAHRRAFSGNALSPWHPFQFCFILKSSKYTIGLLNFLCFSSQFPEDPFSSGNITCLSSQITPDTYEPYFFTYKMCIILFWISQNYWKCLWDHICKVCCCVQ